MPINEWKRSNWLKKAEHWSYQTLLDQLEEMLYLQVVIEQEIKARDRKDVQELKEGAGAPE